MTKIVHLSSLDLSFQNSNWRGECIQNDQRAVSYQFLWLVQAQTWIYLVKDHNLWTFIWFWWIISLGLRLMMRPTKVASTSRDESLYRSLHLSSHCLLWRPHVTMISLELTLMPTFSNWLKHFLIYFNSLELGEGGWGVNWSGV